MRGNSIWKGLRFHGTQKICDTIAQMECDRLREKRAGLEFFFDISIDITFLIILFVES